MEETLISYPTAVLAKEKGFKEPTECFYSPGGQRNTSAYYESTPRNGEPDLWFSGDEFECTAPTQSFLQKWLREVHRFQVHVQFNLHYFWQVKVEDIRYPPEEGEVRQEVDTKWIVHDYETYEQAMEAGLLHTLSFLK